jgi:chromosome segregation protein
MVGQGRIGELIAAKPTDRRALLEEAAGISGLHNRRHEAELRLSAAEQNLARLEDVVTELDGQLEQLKRQARQATRYRNLSGEIRKAEATVLHLRWIGATEALATGEDALAEASNVVTARTSGQAKAAREQAEAAAALPDLRDAAARAGAALQRILHAREQIDAEEARVRARLGELDRRLAQLAEDIAREERMVADNKAILARIDEEEAGIVAANATMEERQAAAAERRASAETTLHDSESALAALTAELAEVTARRGQFERALRDAEGRIARQRGELATVEKELEELAGTAAAESAVEDRRVAVEAAEATAKEAEAAALAAERASAAARDAAGQAREPLLEAERALGRIETEASTLVAILASSRIEGHAPVLDSVKVHAGFEAALGAAFGDDLDAPVDPAAPMHWSLIEGNDDPALPEGAEPLATHVAAPAVLLRRLKLTGLVAREDGARLQPLLKPGQRLVSRKGDLWRWDGYAAAADAPKAAAQRLASQNRLADLDGEAVGARELLAQRKSDLDAATASARAAEEAEKAARETWRRSQRELDQARSALANAERELNRTAARRSALAEAQARLASGIAESEAARDAAQSSLGDTRSPESFTDPLAAAREHVTGDRSALAEARAAFDGLAREAQIRRDRLAAIAVERRNWTERAANAEAQIATLSARRAEAEEEKTKLSEEPARIEERRTALLSEIAAAEAARSEAADALAVGEAAQSAADKAAREALELLSQAREQRVRAEERVVSARERLAEVVHRIAEALECEPQEAATVAELKPDAPLPNLDEIEARFERYKQERERLGAVNLRAEAEAQEVGQRRDQLTGERDDLIAAIQRLRQGIMSLNKEGRERLVAAFDAVNGHFKRLFTHLFGGGEAELQFTESDDPLQAGLEIIAKPPGKKPQSMTLLSGGEQALTAMSLIFAVFLTNPAPICVLDEVDAPLDDANVERFCNLLDEMNRSTDTRFLVITHNPITMARMDRLFGVTMAERGVSQLVSVDLATAERFREAG